MPWYVLNGSQIKTFTMWDLELGLMSLSFVASVFTVSSHWPTVISGILLYIVTVIRKHYSKYSHSYALTVEQLVCRLHSLQTF